MAILPAPLAAESPVPLTVRLYSASAVAPAQIAAARRAASPVLEAAGLAVTFRLCGVAQDGPAVDRCDDTLKPSEVVVRIIDAPLFNTTLDPRSFGVTYVVRETNRGWLATVFADRVVPAAARTGMDGGTLLGLVMAHEVGHLLLGEDSHGARGLMQPEWRDELLERDGSDQWRFTPREAAAIQARLLDR